MLLELNSIRPGLYQAMRKQAPRAEPVVNGWTKFRDWFFGPPAPAPELPKWRPVYGGDKGWIHVEETEDGKRISFASHKEHHQRHSMDRNMYIFTIKPDLEVNTYSESVIRMWIVWSRYEWHHTHNQEGWEKFKESVKFTLDSLQHVIERQNEQDQTRQ